jgi:hypothetical protein
VDDTTEELLDFARSRIASEFGLSEPQGRRLRGRSLSELRNDAAEMRSELGLQPLAEGATRDQHGRFTTAGKNATDMNRIIREASGRR